MGKNSGAVTVFIEVNFSAVYVVEQLGTEEIKFYVADCSSDRLEKIPYHRNQKIEANDNNDCPENDSTDVKEICHTINLF